MQSYWWFVSEFLFYEWELVTGATEERQQRKLGGMHRDIMMDVTRRWTYAARHSAVTYVPNPSIPPIWS